MIEVIDDRCFENFLDLSVMISGQRLSVKANMCASYILLWQYADRT